MAKVLGIGGVFFTSKNPKRLAAWYRRALGFEIEAWGGVAFPWKESATHQRATVWSPFSDGGSFKPSKLPFMLNLVVDDLDAMLASLKKKRIKVEPKRDDSEFGRFAWVMDPDGRKLELWEPPKKPKKKQSR